MIPHHIIDEIKARVPVSELVAQRVKLQRQGSRLVGLSPFTNEKTPSFFVNDAKGFFHCFSTGRHGDVIEWLTAVQGLTFGEAVETLASRAGIQIPQQSEKAAEAAQVRTDLIEVTEIAAKWFEANLRLSGGEPALDYLAKRKILPETQKTFRIGFAPAKGGLRQHLIGKGVPIDVMIEAGLVRPSETGGEPYDFFRGRLMVPIQDERGRVIAFGGRTLDPDGKPKYINTGETPLFHKGRVIFNLHRAIEPARAASSVVVVEGYLDVIAVWQAGFRPVVACMGTALTDAHLNRLWRLAPEPVLCLDGDAAGIRAAGRAVDVALPLLQPGRSLNFAFLRDGKDPDDVVREGGRDAFEKAIGRAAPLVDVLWRRELAGAKTDTPERRAAFEAAIGKLVDSIADARVRGSYRSAIRMRLADLFSWRRAGSPAAARGQEGAKAPEIPDSSGRLDAVILGMCVEYPDLLDSHLERIAETVIRKPELASFRGELVRLASAGQFDPQSVGDQFAPVMRHVHGASEDDAAARGDRLRERMPVLRRLPPPDIVVRIFGALLTQRDIEIAEAEIQAGIDGGGSDDDAERLMALMADTAARREGWIKAQRAIVDDLDALRAAAAGAQ